MERSKLLEGTVDPTSFVQEISWVPRHNQKKKLT